MSRQLFTFEPVFHVAFSSAVVRQSTHVFDLLTTTERPSLATVKATHLMPASRHLIASEFRIGRDAFARSISSRQKRSKPPPVPEMPTVTRTPLFFFWKPSAAAIAYGPTVLDPSAVIVPPERRDARRGSRGRAATAARAAQRVLLFSWLSPDSVGCMRPECRAAGERTWAGNRCRSREGPVNGASRSPARRGAAASSPATQNRRPRRRSRHGSPSLPRGSPGGIGELPVDVALARDVRAGVAAAHRHHDVAPSASARSSRVGNRSARSIPSSRMAVTTSG